VVAIAPALWLFVDRMAGTQMSEPLTWDKIPNLDNGRVTFNGNGLPTHAGRVGDLLHAQRPDGLQLVAGPLPGDLCLARAE
jgi:hypothetical protein